MLRDHGPVVHVVDLACRDYEGVLFLLSPLYVAHVFKDVGEHYDFFGVVAAVDSAGQYEEPAYLAVQVPFLAAAQMVHQAVVILLGDDAHVAHAAVHHGGQGKIDQAIAATGGIKLVLGDTGTADLSGLVGDSSMYVSDGTVWQVYGDVAAATNLTVKGTLLATGIEPKVAAEQIVFDGGKVVIGEPAAYPMLQGTVTGAIEVDFADGLAGDSITALAHLGAEAAATTLTLTPVGNAAKYTVQREKGEQEDGTFTVYYKLIRNFFYIRIR